MINRKIARCGVSVFALIFREESRASLEMRVGNLIWFFPRDHAAGNGRWDMENLRDAPKTRVHEGSFLGRSMGIWHLVFKLVKLVKSLLGADPDSVRPVVA